jgi:hypothetical protein
MKGCAETRHKFDIWDLNVEIFGIWIARQLAISADSNSISSSGEEAKAPDAAPVGYIWQHLNRDQVDTPELCSNSL